MHRSGFRRFIGTGALLAALAVGCTPSLAPEPSDGPALQQQEAHQSTPTGSLAWSGYYFTSTRLSDGRVLVVGGRDRGSIAEIYDPATGTFSMTPYVPDGRSLHATVLLHDGQPLVTGGEDPYTAVDALRYDLATSVWSPAGTMNTPRQGHGAVVLPDGKVLVTGGTNYFVSMAPFASCELFDPTTNTWTNTGSMNKARSFHSTVVLPDGRVLVTGGDGYLTAELYDPATGTWSLTGSPAYGRRHGVSVLLKDGRVLVAGGNTGTQAEIYNPATGTWTQAGAMAQARTEHAAVVLSNGTVLVFGGNSSSGTPLASVESFNPVTQTWSPAAPMLSARYSGGAVLLDNGQVLLMGGIGNGDQAELYTHDMACTPATCADQGKTCGLVPNGCGGMLTCGTCTSAQACTADNVCVSSSSSFDGAPLFDSLLNAPRCSMNTGRCGSGNLLEGRAGLGPEPHAPNTLVTSPCADGTAGTYQVDASLESLTVSSNGSQLTGNQQVQIQASVYASAQYSTNALDLYGASDASSPAWYYITTLVPPGSGLRFLERTYTLPVGGAYQAIRGVFRVGGSVDSTCGQGSTTDTDDLVFPVSPPAPPTAQVTAPLEDARLQGQVLLKASATSTYRVSRVDFYAGSTLLCSDQFAPYECTWDTVASNNGPHTLKAIAYDPTGASGTSPLVSVTVTNDKLAPSAAIQSPTAGKRVRGTVSVGTSLTDDVGLSRGELYLDGVLLHSAAYTTAPASMTLSTSWNSTLVADGAHTVFARAYDTAGKVGESAAVQFIVDNTPPTAAITSPASGTQVVGSVQVTAEASDAQGIQSVVLLVDGTVSTTKTAAPYTFTWNSEAATNGTHTLAVRATDMTGHQTTSPSVSVTVNNPLPVTAVYDTTRRAPGCASAVWSCDSGSLLKGRGPLGPELNAPNTLNGSCVDGSSGSYLWNESLERLKVSTLDGAPMAAGKTVRIDATVWAYSTGSSDSLDLYYTANAASPTWTYLTTLKPPGGGQRVLSATYTLPAGTLQAVRGVFRYSGTRSACGWGSYTDHDDLFFVTQ